ncbi:MAG: oxaloacetate decarboxylase subunit gamma [Syntrophomonas sp.]|nr:oxaloacetate decarboxylase subunit gamma [Syntrophomonas sp.]
MSLPLVVCLSGLGGVFTVMIFLLISLTLSSKLAQAIEKRYEQQAVKENTTQ